MLSVACCDVAVSAPGETFHGMKKTQTKEDLQVDTGAALVSLLAERVSGVHGERERERGQQEIFMGVKCASLDRVRGPTWECTGAGPPAIHINYVISSSGGRRSHSSAASQLGVASRRAKNGDDFRRADKTLWLARTHDLATCAVAPNRDIERDHGREGHRGCWREKQCNPQSIG